MKARSLILNSIFIFVLIASIIAIRHLVAVPLKLTQKVQDYPDAYMKNVILKRFDEKGNCQLLMQTPKLIHYQKHNSSYITKPTMIVFQDRGNWHITSETATSVNGVETIYLNKKVNIKQNSPHSNKLMTEFNTQFLTYFPKRNYAMTNEFVKITQPGFTITSTGLKANLEKGDVQLLSKTRGIYDPAH